MIETWHPVLRLLVVTLAVARVTVLFVDDKFLELPRGYLLAKLDQDGYLTYLLTCQRCMGFWVSLTGALAWFRWPIGTTMVAVPWAVATIAWWFGGQWLAEDDDE